jgi:hypothetical protein
MLRINLQSMGGTRDEYWWRVRLDFWIIVIRRVPDNHMYLDGTSYNICSLIYFSMQRNLGWLGSPWPSCIWKSQRWRQIVIDNTNKVDAWVKPKEGARDMPFFPNYPKYSNSFRKLRETSTQQKPPEVQALQLQLELFVASGCALRKRNIIFIIPICCFSDFQINN